jgi:hypothetical protein
MNYILTTTTKNNTHHHTHTHSSPIEKETTSAIYTYTWYVDQSRRNNFKNEEHACTQTTTKQIYLNFSNLIIKNKRTL